MYHATLRDFLVEGRLGPVRAGLTQADLRSLLEKPEDTSISRKPRIWKYGSLEVSFPYDSNQAQLAFIGVYFRDSHLDLPSGLVLDGWWPEPGSRLPDFSEQIQRQGVSMAEIAELTFDDQLTLRTDAGVNVIFVRDQGEFVLDSIQFHAPKDKDVR